MLTNNHGNEVMVNIKQLTLLVTLCLSMLSMPVIAKVTAQVDRELMSDDEALRLIIEAEGKDKDSEPDLSPLSKDFEVRGSSQSSRMQIINGQTNSSKQWQITLLPKRTGELIIPPITVGSKTTQPIKVKVVSAAQLNPQSAKDNPIFVEATVDTTTPYVQEQVILTIRFYHRTELRSGSLSEPEIDNAVVEKLGDDTNSRAQKNGQIYGVIERRYAIFPQQSGPLEIPAIRFEGTIPDNRRSQRTDPFGRGFFNDPFDMMQSTKSIRRKSESIQLNVKTIPNNFSGKQWLPAHSLQLREQWSPENPTFEVGKPVTRTITVISEGLTAAQLPILDIPSLDKANIYPDQNAQENRANDNGIVGLLQQKLAFLPSAPGTVTLPEISVPWWNTQTKRFEVATLPAKQIAITGTAKTPSSVNSPSILTDSETQTLESNDSDIETQRVIHKTASYWPWISALFAALWLITTFLWQQERKKSPSTTEPVKSDNRNAVSLDKLKHAIQTHSLNNDATATRTALIQWAQQYWPKHPIRNLGDIKRLCSHQACAEQIQKLDSSLYTQDHNWDGSQLYHTLEAWMDNYRNSSKQTNHHKLPGLYS